MTAVLASMRCITAVRTGGIDDLGHHDARLDLHVRAVVHTESLMLAARLIAPRVP